jgi:hypothetical protein
MQAGERQLHLRLHTCRPQQVASVDPPDQVVQQHGLAHAGLPAQHQHLALAGPDRVHEPVQQPAFAVPVG